MEHHYTAKVYFEDDDEIIETSGDDLELLITWMENQAEISFGEIKGEIIDNRTHQIVKSIQYSPPE